MNEVYPSKQFQKSFKKLPTDIKNIAIKKDKLFRDNPNSPQLKTHRLKGKLSTFWAYSVKYSYRVVFEFIDEQTVLYHDIGTHEIYR